MTKSDQPNRLPMDSTTDPTVEISKLFAQAHQKLAQHDEMEAYLLFDRAVAFAERFLPNDHPKRASAYANLAMMEENPGRAKSLLESAIQIERQVPNTTRLTTLLSNLAVIQQDLEEPESALQSFEEAISLLESQTPTSVRQTQLASLYFQMAILLQEMEETGRAVDILWSAIFIAGRDTVRCEAVALHLYYMATFELSQNHLTPAVLYARVSLYILLLLEENTGHRFFETLAQRIQELEKGAPCTEHSSLIAAWIVEHDPEAKAFLPSLRQMIQNPDQESAERAQLERFLAKLSQKIAECGE
ncbi:MAG: tetratricopeptide repeat protein [Thermoguttaceae bacterium]|nr:tetratricopeptide repeat protein [Thermoguttaceae bacterium]